MANPKVYAEEQVLQQCAAEHAELLQPRPDFSDLLEDLDPYVCDRAELVALLADAPSIALRQYLYAIFQFRQTIALMTGRKF